jgi:glutamyl-tRNA synthetase
LEKLRADGRAYPCFCSPAELAAMRRAQRAAGIAPRYDGRCAKLSAQQISAKYAAGYNPAMRFRMPADGEIILDDIVRGRVAFRAADLGDFVVRRADGVFSFFFANAVDDAASGVNWVLRGEDHIANTPRQLALLSALSLPAPRYGHIALLVGEDGRPLAKRGGAMAARDLRKRGFLPKAVINHLARLGHYYREDDLFDFTQLAARFDEARLGRAAARFDEARLRRWQKTAADALSPKQRREWLADELAAVDEKTLSTAKTDALIDAVRENLTLPEDLRPWLGVAANGIIAPDAAATAAIHAAGGDFFRAAEEAINKGAADFPTLARAVSTAADKKGKALFLPLRAALTGQTAGPQMPPLFQIIGTKTAAARLRAAAALCA